MKKICLVAALVLAIQPFASHASPRIPKEATACLLGNPLNVQPKGFREFARVTEGKATYYYLYPIYKVSDIDSIPSSANLVKVEAVKCKNFRDPAMSIFEDISKFVPSKVASVLVEGKWRTILKLKDGPKMVQDIVNPHPGIVTTNMGEELPPIVLNQIDKDALRKIGVLK